MQAHVLLCCLGSGCVGPGIRNVLGHHSKLHHKVSHRSPRYRSFKNVLFQVCWLWRYVHILFSLLTFLQHNCDVVRVLSISFSFLSASTPANFGDVFTPVESSSVPYKYFPQDIDPGLNFSLFKRSEWLQGVAENTSFSQPHANFSRVQTQRRQQCSRNTFLTSRHVSTCRQFMLCPGQDLNCVRKTDENACSNSPSLLLVLPIQPNWNPLSNYTSCLESQGYKSQGK